MASKEVLKSRIRDGFQAHLGTGSWTLRQKLALICRILSDDGHDSELAGQITARAEEPNTFYTQRLGLGFDEITASNLLVVDEDLNVLDGDGAPNPGNRFHSWIYRARPDVTCILHTHPLHVSALSMLREPLVVSHMDTTALYDDCAFLPEWPGLPIGNDEGKIIADALGNKRAILLAHHGQLVACSTPEEACVMALRFERAARLQLMAAAAGSIKDIRPELAREAHDWMLSERISEATFQCYARRSLRHHADCLE